MTDVVVLAVAGLPIAVAVVLAVVEVVTRPDLSTLRRVAWIVALILVPVVGVAIYAVVRPLRHPGATARHADGPPDAERLVVAAEQRQRGEIDDDEFRRAVAEITPQPS